MNFFLKLAELRTKRRRAVRRLSCRDTLLVIIPRDTRSLKNGKEDLKRCASFSFSFLLLKIETGHTIQYCLSEDFVTYIMRDLGKYSSSSVYCVERLIFLTSHLDSLGL